MSERVNTAMDAAFNAQQAALDAARQAGIDMSHVTGNEYLNNPDLQRLSAEIILAPIAYKLVAGADRDPHNANANGVNEVMASTPAELADRTNRIAGVVDALPAGASKDDITGALSREDGWFYQNLMRARDGRPATRLDQRLAEVRARQTNPTVAHERVRMRMSDRQWDTLTNSINYPEAVSTILNDVGDGVARKMMIVANRPELFTRPSYELSEDERRELRGIVSRADINPEDYDLMRKAATAEMRRRNPHGVRPEGTDATGHINTGSLEDRYARQLQVLERNLNDARARNDTTLAGRRLVSNLEAQLDNLRQRAAANRANTMNTLRAGLTRSQLRRLNGGDELRSHVILQDQPPRTDGRPPEDDRGRQEDVEADAWAQNNALESNPNDPESRTSRLNTARDKLAQALAERSGSDVDRVGGRHLRRALRTIGRVVTLGRARRFRGPTGPSAQDTDFAAMNARIDGLRIEHDTALEAVLRNRVSELASRLHREGNSNEVIATQVQTDLESALLDEFDSLEDGVMGRREDNQNSWLARRWFAKNPIARYTARALIGLVPAGATGTAVGAGFGALVGLGALTGGVGTALVVGGGLASAYFGRRENRGMARRINRGSIATEHGRAVAAGRRTAAREVYQNDQEHRRLTSGVDAQFIQRLLQVQRNESGAIRVFDRGNDPANPTSSRETPGNYGNALALTEAQAKRRRIRIMGAVGGAAAGAAYTFAGLDVGRELAGNNPGPTATSAANADKQPPVHYSDGSNYTAPIANHSAFGEIPANIDPSQVPWDALNQATNGHVSMDMINHGVSAYNAYFGTHLGIVQGADGFQHVADAAGNFIDANGPTNLNNWLIEWIQNGGK